MAVQSYDTVSPQVSYVYLPQEHNAGNEQLLGGKGAQLTALAVNGFPVPSFVCVTTRVFNEVWRQTSGVLSTCIRELFEIDSDDNQLTERIRAIAARAQAAMRSAGISAPACRAIRSSFTTHFGSDARVAVRSSVVGEDSAINSFAGQMDTYLSVGYEGVIDYVLECLASTYSERALLYRHARKMRAQVVKAGVVVQVMVPAKASGVVFTANPTTGDTSELIVSAGLGLGEGVVGGLVETDTFYVRKADGEVSRREIVTKSRRVVPELVRSHGSSLDEVPRELRTRPAVSQQELSKVIALAQRLEQHNSSPQDIEWTLEPNGTLRLLQSRPITTLSHDRMTVLVNANIVESYPGLSSPLTFSFVRNGYTETFREAARRFGVSSARLKHENALFASLVAFVDGRIYYNILQWYRFYELLGFERAIPAWERALGLGNPIERGPSAPSPRVLRRLYIRARIVINLFARSRQVGAYLETLRAAVAEIEALDLDSLDGHRLLELFEDMMRRLLAPYAVAVVNDFYTQQFYDLVGRLLARWKVRDAEELRNALVSGDSQIDSVLPVQSLMRLAEQVRANDTLRAVFESEPDDGRLWEVLKELPEAVAFRKQFRQHLAQYGDRTLHELKLETPSLSDDPGYAIRMLRGYVRAPREAVRPETVRLRMAAATRIRSHLRARPLRRAALTSLIRYSRQAIRYRENLRLARARGIGVFKRIVGALGHLFSEHRIIDDERDIFFLTMEEIAGAIRGHVVNQDLQALVAIRKQEYARFGERSLPPRITTRGIVQAASFPRDLGASSEHDATVLSGLGCSRGVVQGRAVVVTDPQQRIEVTDRILVAPMTDPGWVFLMVAGKGLIVEKGSLLSHTAIVARELGIPTVVGVEGATQSICDGDLVEVNGSTGSVRVIERASAAPPGADRSTDRRQAAGRR